MELAFIGSRNKIMLSCTYCWQAHTGHEYNGEVLVFGGCGHDPRRYFSDHDDYTAYVRAYRAAGNDHGTPRAWLPQGRVVKMTPRCLARFQSFPDDYILPGNNRLAYEIVGNACPPLMMQRIYEGLVDP